MFEKIKKKHIKKEKERAIIFFMLWRVVRPPLPPCPRISVYEIFRVPLLLIFWQCYFLWDILLFFSLCIFFIYVDDLPSQSSYAHISLESSMLAVAKWWPQLVFFCNSLYFSILFSCSALSLSIHFGILLPTLLVTSFDYPFL